MVRSWLNTNPATKGIAGVQIRSSQGGLWGTVRANSEDSPFHWGEVEVEAVYAENSTSTRGIAFVARYDFGFVETLIEGNVNSGLLVLAAFHVFHDGTNRANYFSREFFHEVTT